MCGRVVQARPIGELAEAYDAIPDETAFAALRPRFNVAPTDPLAVIVPEPAGRRLTAHRWGLLPPRDAAAARTRSPLINARAETIALNPLFRAAFERRRCLVPVDGFYEWERLADRRQPYFIHRADGRPLTLAGIWAPWREAPDGGLIGTCSIVTTVPDPVVGRLHDRMPVLLAAEAWAAWLDPATDGRALQRLLRPSSGVVLQAHAVRPLVNNVRNDGPALLEPVTS